MQRLRKTITIIVAAITAVTALYIMFHGLGLVDSLDFGAGAYYYADIPDYDKYMHENAYANTLPLWVYIVLFLGWGYLMWRLWVWIEKKR